MLGSIDSNTGSPDLGWDTDQFPMDIKNTTMVMKVCLIFLMYETDLRSAEKVVKYLCSSSRDWSL